MYDARAHQLQSASVIFEYSDYMCPHITIYVLTLLCVLIPLHVRILLHECPDTTVDISVLDKGQGTRDK